MVLSRAYEEIIDFIAHGSSPREVSEFTPSPEVKARAGELVAREKAGKLTPTEKDELEHYVQLEHIMRLAKARARQLLYAEQTMSITDKGDYNRMRKQPFKLIFLVPCCLCVYSLFTFCRVVWSKEAQSQLNERLITAISNNDADAAQNALKAGADPNTYASKYGVATLWQRLQSNVSDTHASFDAPPAILLAMEPVNTGDYRLLDLLLTYGANPNVDNFKQSSPLTIAAQYGEEGAVKMLLKKGANVNFRGFDGDTPLIAACRFYHTDVVRLLLASHADPNLRLPDGKAAIDFVPPGSVGELERILQQAGAKRL